MILFLTRQTGEEVLVNWDTVLYADRVGGEASSPGYTRLFFLLPLGGEPFQMHVQEPLSVIGVALDAIVTS